MEHRAGGIQGLKLVLNVQGREDVLGVAHGQVGRVGIIRCLPRLGGGDDIGVVLLVVLCQAVGGGLGWGCLQVIEVSVLLLIVRQAPAHMVQHRNGERLGLFMGQILPQPRGVQAHLVHADKAQGGEVVLEGSEIPLCIGIQPRLHELGNHGALDFQAPGGDVHELIQPLVEFLRGLGQIGDLRHIDGHHADGACGFTASEETAGLFPQFPQVQAQAAAHGAHIAGLHIAVDVVGKVRGTVFCGHFKQELIILRLGPVKVSCNGVGGNGILEAPAVGIALNHNFNERPVHHVHFLFAVLIFKGHLLAAHNGGKLRHVVGDSPVQGDVGEGRLGAPAGGGVDTIDKGFNALFHLVIAQIICLDKGRQVSIEGGECLGPGPLVLHNAQEVHHLVAEGSQVLGGGRGNLSRDAAQSFLNQLAQRPSGAVACEHGHIMNMNVTVFMGAGNLIVVNLAEPVVGGDGTGVGQNQAAYGVSNRRIFLHPPVLDLQIAVNQRLVVQEGGLHVPQLFPLAAVENVGLGHIVIARPDEHGLHAVLNVLHGNLPVFYLGAKVGGDLQSQKIDDVVRILLFLGVEGLSDRRGNFLQVKGHDLIVSFHYLIHKPLLFLKRPEAQLRG